MIYTGNALKEISFPIGGIGTGSIGLAGNGTLIDFEIFNRPNKGGGNQYTFMAVRAQKKSGETVSKVLSGDMLKDIVGQYTFAGHHTGYGYGPPSVTMQGFPHFRKVIFDGRFPIARVTFEDEDFPGRVKLTAFNPFIPLHEDESSMPAAFFEIEIENADEDCIYTHVFAATNPLEESENTPFAGEKRAGVFMTGQKYAETHEKYANLTLECEGEGAFAQPYWYRGSWQDGIATFWREFESNAFRDRRYASCGNNDVCTVGLTLSLGARETGKGRFVFFWYVPNNANYWDPLPDENGKNTTWKNYYAVLFASSREVSSRALSGWNELFEKTDAFTRALHGQSLPECVIDACASTLSVLKSPTVLRLEDGSFYGWEGVQEKLGSCEGTCTHVWSYQYALAFLFPKLERSLRMNEFENSVYPSGGMRFRMPLPKGRKAEMGRACLDGQMATVFKTLREWKLSGDDEWLKSVWPYVKKVLGYAWSNENIDKWDEGKNGILTGRQHHTLDMELFGPSAWLQGMYLAALKAASEMAEYLHDIEAKREYDELFECGYAFTKENLFNGEYFIQKTELSDKSVIDKFDAGYYWNEEKQEIKYQIAEGSSIDQMLGQWHANVLGLGNIFDSEQKKRALDSMMKYNYKPTMRNFANPWRIFAMNDEAGSIICGYPPHVKKPAIPIPYCEEAMHGFEYAFAGLLASEGRVDDAVRVVDGVRGRYKGFNRNPFNEIECGSNYARSMASFALIPILSGFMFDLPKKTIGFNPRIGGDFRCAFFTAAGWGEFEKTQTTVRICVKEGKIGLERIRLPFVKSVKEVKMNGRPVGFRFENGCLVFDKLLELSGTTEIIL